MDTRNYVTESYDTKSRQAGKSIARGAYPVIVAGLALSLMLSGRVSAQETQRQNQDQSQPAQQQAQPQPAPPDQTNEQAQAPASPNRPATPPVAKAKPKYASQDASNPVYAKDGRNPSPYSAPAPTQDSSQDPSLNNDPQGNGDPQANDPQAPAPQANAPQGPGGDVPDTNQNDPNQNAPYPQQDPNAAPDAQQDNRQAPPPPPYRGYRNRPPQDGRYDNGYSQPAPARPTAPLPSSLLIPAGTVVSVRVNEFLSSDKNQVGDRVTATLERPIVVNGWVVARRGQILTGQVTAAVKAGRIKGTSQLGLELTDLTLVDGHDAPILTEIWKGSGGTSHGADAATIGGTTAVGAAIGAAADWGRGAAIGAGAGAAAGIGAVLLTRGRPTEILPETPLTFRLKEPVTVDTTQSAQSFAPVTQQDYDNGQRGYRDGRRYSAGYGPYGYPAYGYPGPYAYPYPGYGYPYYYSPGVVFYGGGWGWRGRRW
jgi:hypothetical protein